MDIQTSYICANSDLGYYFNVATVLSFCRATKMAIFLLSPLPGLYEWMTLPLTNNTFIVQFSQLWLAADDIIWIPCGRALSCEGRAAHPEIRQFVDDSMAQLTPNLLNRLSHLKTCGSLKDDIFRRAICYGVGCSNDTFRSHREKRKKMASTHLARNTAQSAHWAGSGSCQKKTIAEKWTELLKSTSSAVGFKIHADDR